MVNTKKQKNSKDLNRSIHKITSMRKNGQIIELFGILIIIGIVIFGTSTVYFQKDNAYVGDTLEFKAYKYSDCKDYINSLPRARLIAFPSENEIPTEYNMTRCD